MGLGVHNIFRHTCFPNPDLGSQEVRKLTGPIGCLDRWRRSAQGGLQRPHLATAMDQNPSKLVNSKISGKWMSIPPHIWYVCIYIYICMYVCLSVRPSVCLYVCMSIDIGFDSSTFLYWTLEGSIFHRSLPFQIAPCQAPSPGTFHQKVVGVLPRVR